MAQRADFQGDVVIAIIPVIGPPWLLMDTLLSLIETRTVQRWSMVRNLGVDS